MNLAAKYMAVLCLVSSCHILMAQDVRTYTSNSITIELLMPKCHGEPGKLKLASHGTKDDITYSTDNQSFYAFESEIDLEIGYHNVFIRTNNTIELFEVNVMPMEDIMFDFIDIFPANCNGEGGRIVASVTATGEAGMPSTGSGTILFNATSFDQQIDIEVDAGEYTVTAFLNENVQRDTIVVVPKVQCKIYLPNVISPFAKQDNNKLFIPGFDEGTNPIITEYFIFDKWGNKIYNQQNIVPDQFNHWWDGSCQGQPCASGVYSYLIEVEFESGNKIEETGTVTLL